MFVRNCVTEYNACDVAGKQLNDERLLDPNNAFEDVAIETVCRECGR